MLNDKPDAVNQNEATVKAKATKKPTVPLETIQIESSMFL